MARDHRGPLRRSELATLPLSHEHVNNHQSSSRRSRRAGALVASSHRKLLSLEVEVTRAGVAEAMMQASPPALGIGLASAHGACGHLYSQLYSHQ